MRETEPQKPIVIHWETPETQFYGYRLIQSIQLLYEIDTGNFPMTHYTAEGGAPVSIYSQNKFPYERGLRVGVLDTIFGSWKWLKENGTEQEVYAAQIIIDAARDRNRREGLL